MGAFTGDGGPPTTQPQEEPEQTVDTEKQVEPDKIVEPEPEKKEPEPAKEPEKKEDEPEKKEPEKETDIPDSTPAKKEDESEDEEPEGFKTDVAGVMADGEVSQGITKYPVFKVTKGEFYQNMRHGRKRLRFKTGSNAQQYMSKTRYKRAFYIQYTDSAGKDYSRRIK